MIARQTIRARTIAIYSVVVDAPKAQANKPIDVGENRRKLTGDTVSAGPKVSAAVGQCDRKHTS